MVLDLWFRMLTFRGCPGAGQEVSDVNDIGFSQASPFSLDQAHTFYTVQLIEKLIGLLFGASKGLHHFCYCEDDIDTAFLVQPAVFHR